MDWSQCLTMIGTISVLTVGSTWAFYKITKEDIAIAREQIAKMDNNHREDMKNMNDNHREDMKAMDTKWERLFEKLLIKE